MIQLSESQLASIIGVSEEDLKSLIYEDGSEELKDGFESEIASQVKDKINEARRQGVDRGFEKKGKRIERALSGLLSKNNLELSDFATAEEAIQELEQLNSSQQPPNEGVKDLNPDELIKLPQVKQLISERTKALEQEKAQLEDQAKKALSEKTDYIKASEFKKFARQKLEGKNPVALTDAAIEMLYQQHRDKLAIDNGQFKLVNQDGEQLEDENFNPIQPDSWLENVWGTTFGFSEVPQGHKSPAPPTQSTSGKPVYNFQSAQEYQAALDAAGADHAKRNEIRQARIQQLEKQG